MAINATKQTITNNATADKTSPRLNISSDHSVLKAGETATITFTFSEPTQDFTAGDITVSRGTISNLINSGDDKTYTATFTPTANVNTLNAK
ncbi:MAG: hypothetical protein K9L60_05170, partial [Methylovulum sp.]|nr:hypothetical protein [Methylovulum sp.]